MARHEEISITNLVLVSEDGSKQYKFLVGNDGKLNIYKLVSGTWTFVQAIDIE